MAARKPTFASHHVSELAICSECGAAVGPGRPLHTHIDWHARLHRRALPQGVEIVQVTTPRKQFCAYQMTAQPRPRSKKGD